MQKIPNVRVTVEAEMDLVFTDRFALIPRNLGKKAQS